jgi:hypothetical protein
VIPGGVEHEGHVSEDSEVIDFFAPVREDFLAGGPHLVWHSFARGLGSSAERRFGG